MERASYATLKDLNYWDFWMYQHGKRGAVVKNNTLAELQKIWHKNQYAEFTYKQGLPYILLTEEKIQPDMFYLDYTYGDSALTTINSFLLDKELSVVCTGSAKRDLDQELKLFVDQLGVIPFLSYLDGKYQLPVPTLPPIKYIKFSEINDFQFGRTGFGRLHQSYKIQSDSISKDHCSITHLKTDNSKEIKKFQILKKKLQSSTPISSASRMITEELWQTICEFAGVKQRYTLCDLGSRNGTWITKNQQKRILMKENLQYQFEGENYAVHVSKIFTSKDSEGQSILEHNFRVQKLLEQFRKEVNWCYYEPAKKMIVFGPGEDMNKIASKDSEKISIVVLKIKYRDCHEFYFLGITESSKKVFQVGSKQEIDVSPDEEEFPTLQGYVYLQNGSWVLETQWDLSGSNRKIWTKIPKDYSYNLNPKHFYKIRLGYTSTFDIQFFNF